MRMVNAAVAGLLVLSCAGAGIDGENLSEGDGERNQDTAMEEYDAIERLEENPLDLKRATREMLLEIPGFPPRLAARVIGVRNGRSTVTQLLERLTPAERETLYRFRRFLVLPQRRTTRIRARAGLDRVGMDGSERADTYLSVENEVWRVRLRSRSSVQGGALSPYVSRRVLSSSLNLCGGDFVPDFAMGLLFNGAPYFYPFSPGFPFRGRRWIVPAPSWYSEAVRGCAVEARRGCIRGMLFTGRPRTYTGRSIEIDDRSVWGGRVRADVRRGEVGFTCRRGELDACGPLCSVDCRWRAATVQTALELVAAGPGRGAATWGVSLREDRIDAGLVAYRVPYGSGTGFASVPGGAIRASSWQRGCAAVMSGTAYGRSIVRASYERYVSGDAAERRERESIRMELETKWRPASLRVSYRWRLNRDTDGIPYPTGGTVQEASESESGHILFIGRRGAALQVRLSARFISEEGDRGYLLAPSVRFGLLRRHVRCTVAGCVYRSVSGEPVLYTYEPGFEGSYPWISVRGNGWRGTVLIDVRWGHLTVSVRTFTGTTLDTGLGMMVSYRM
ncbi:MAG TPA: hypothetical protein VMX58_12100 [Patescibacteria group bacterium]|nr:hypothetical protein [Patescibacteria group bacterium]